MLLLRRWLDRDGLVLLERLLDQRDWAVRHPCSIARELHRHLPSTSSAVRLSSGLLRDWLLRLRGGRLLRSCSWTASTHRRDVVRRRDRLGRGNRSDDVVEVGRCRRRLRARVGLVLLGKEGEGGQAYESEGQLARVRTDSRKGSVKEVALRNDEQTSSLEGRARS
jgi:hypothetical protein